MHRRHIIICAILLFLGTVSFAHAQGILDGESCHVEADTIITGNLFVLCGELKIEGVVNGSVIGVARTTHFTGAINGSIYLLGVELNVGGTLEKDVHFGGVSLNITPQAEFLSPNGSIISGTLSNRILAGSVVPGHFTVASYQLVIDGDVEGEVNFWGSALTINGTIGQDVFATVGNAENTGVASQIETLLIPFRIDVTLIDPGLVISESGKIGGQLEYTSSAIGVIDGEVTRPPIFNSTLDPLLIGPNAEPSAQNIGRFLQATIREFSSLVFIGFLCVLLIPRYVEAPIRTLQRNPVSTLGIGLLGFIMSFPIVLVFALLSIGLIVLLITLRLNNVVLFTAIVLGLTNVGSASIFYFVAIYIARIVVALAVGRFIVRVLLRTADDGTWRYMVLSMVIGVLMLSFLGSIPTIGIGLNALALFFGLGAILSMVRTQYRKLIRPTSAHPPTTATSPLYTPEFLPKLPYLSDEAVNYPPPLIEDTSALGSDNLPDGFNWWQSDYNDEE
jgi:hypothetical protein